MISRKDVIRHLLLLSAVIGVMFITPMLFGQPVDPQTVPKPEVNETLVTLITGLGIVVTPWAIWGAAILFPKLPRAILPLLPFVFGFATDQLTKIAAGVDSPIGAAGIGYIVYILREIPNTLLQHGLKGGGGQIVPTAGAAIAGTGKQ